MTRELLRRAYEAGYQQGQSGNALNKDHMFEEWLKAVGIGE